jgi:hypothetical protein
VPQVKLSASKEELELRNEVIKEEKNTDNSSSKVNSKTQNIISYALVAKKKLYQ